MMDARQVMKALAAHRGDAVVVCALGTASSQWWNASKCEETLYMTGGMGFAASIALGIALSLPKTPVWVINCDGSLCMNLNGLLTEAAQQPQNLKHFVIDNEVYQTLDKPMPMVNQRRTDYVAIARAAGIANAVLIDDVAELEKRMPEIVAAPGPYFVDLKVAPMVDYPPVPPYHFEGHEMKYRFARNLEKKLGIAVFGPRGY
jgi:thiamine pyrophosphate-dependent acetolactate synthase large subunit-like protein